MSKYEHKTKKTKQSVSAFLNAIEDPQKRKDAKALHQLHREVTGKRAAMWGSSIVGYDQYTFTGKSGISGVWPMAGFSPRKTALTVYIMRGFAKQKALLKKLGPHKTGVCCLYIKRLDDIHLPTLKKLISWGYSEMKKNEK